MLLYQVIQCYQLRFSLPYFTCAVNAVSSVSWFACTNVRAFSVVTESIGVAVMLSCLTLVYICKIVIQELSLNENEIDSSHMKK